MNKRIVLHTVGWILILEAVLMTAPLVVSLVYGETLSRNVFLMVMGITAAAGGLLLLLKPKKSNIFAREGFAIVSISWILMSLFGCLPFCISGCIPHFVDAFFETVSGFTTTGASILTDVEALDHAMVFWRSFTHWVGGMGVLVFVMVILPLGGGSSMHLLRAESPGPVSGKLVPKMHGTARILYGIYLVLTLLLFVILWCGGMPVFDCLINAFGTAGTGGFSNWGASIGHYNNEFFEVVIGIFMLLFGVNFNLYYLLLLKRVKTVFKSSELRVYIGIVVFSVLTIAWNIQGLYENFHQALRYSFFQVSTIITTTGFATTDFNLWPQYSRTLLVVLMLFGACAGSTAGGLKISRVMLLFKAARRGIKKMIHNRSMEGISFDKKAVDEETVSNCTIYLCIYVVIVVLSVAVLSLDNFSLETNLTGTIACLNNIGPGLDLVGPTGNFAMFSWVSKLVLAFDMLAGRLELFPLLILFLPEIWKRGPYSRFPHTRSAQHL